MAARRGTFAFDLSKPSRKGMMLKQGHYHKAFKHRFFVLYSGFLVYYDDEQRWKYDITRGETLASRIGAVKLKGGTVQIARDAPKGCKFGLIIQAPDPANKRQFYLLNALNKPDRNAWIEAVRNCIPQSRSPQPVRKDVKKRAPKEQELVPPHPSFTTRQDTADVAALEVSGTARQEEHVEETSIDQILPPSMAIRHDTADAAALLSASVSPPSVERVTSIDEELGPMQTNEDSSRETTPGKERSVSPPPTPTELETNETVENSVNAKGKVEVVTSVTVVANGVENEDVVEKDSEEPTADLEEEEEPHRKTSEVTFTREEPSNSFSVIVANVESGDSSSLVSDGEGESALVEPESKGNTYETEFQDQTEVESPSATPTITVDEVQLRQEEATPGDQSGNSSPIENGSKASLTPPESPREARKAFTEKRGFLYKRGGHRKSWNLRYFVLQPGGFTYYKKDPRTKPLGEVKLKNMNIFYPGVGEKQQSYQFHVHTESSWNKRPTWVLAAQSEREMKTWIQAFKLAGMLSGTSPANSDSEGEPNGAIPAHS